MQKREKKQIIIFKDKCKDKEERAKEGNKMNVYTNEDYSKAYSEVLEVLRYIPKVDLVKIPKDEIMFYIKNMDNKHNYKYNFNITNTC